MDTKYFKITSNETIIYAREKIIDLIAIGQLARNWHHAKFVNIEPAIYKKKERWKIIFQISNESEIRKLFLYFSANGDFEAANFND